MLPHTYMPLVVLNLIRVWALLCSISFALSAQTPLDLERFKLENGRCWSPGEPLTWVSRGRIDSLLAMDLDGFLLVVSSPQGNIVRKSIRYIRSSSKDEALFMEGDFRYISYDMETLRNASTSIVVGYSYWASPYWNDGTLCFQNGHSNWHIHAKRHFHSKITGQIELSISDIPDGAEYTLALPGDSATFFIPIEGDPETDNKPGPLYELKHNRQNWEVLGASKIRFKVRQGWRRAFQLRDYWIISDEHSAIVVRKSDLHFARVRSSVFEVRSRFLHNSAYVIKGNHFGYCMGDNTCIWDNVDSLVSNLKLMPLIEPLPENWQEKETASSSSLVSDKKNLPLLILLVIQGVALMVIGGKSWSKKQKKLLISADGAETEPTALLAKFLLRADTHMGTAELDDLFGLGDVHSPETRRSRRSRMISMLNIESAALFGMAIIKRERSKTDKRVVLYHIANPDTSDDQGK
jgi:hypothetical protein